MASEYRTVDRGPCAAKVEPGDLRDEDARIREFLQPLSVLVARAEVIGDLARQGPRLDLLNQLDALRESAQRVATEADALGRELDGGRRPGRTAAYAPTRIRSR